MLKVFEYVAIIAAILFVVAVIGLIVMYSLQPSEEPKDQQHTKEHQAASNESEGGKSFWQRTTEDPVALFTFWVAIFTFALAAVAVGQYMLLVRAEYTSTQAANAARKSAEIAERALIAGQRAFVSVTSFKTVGLVDHKTGHVTHWSFAPVWTNAGNTPTRNMTNHVSLILFDGEMPEDWDFPDMWGPQTRQEERVPTPIGISPKNFIEGQVIKVPVKDIADVIAGKKWLYLWGWAAYSDVFPKTDRHITRFAVQIHIGGDPRAHDPKQISFDYLFIKKYNCSDEECDHQGRPASWVARSLVP